MNLEVKPLGKSPRIHIILKNQIVCICVNLNIFESYFEDSKEIS